MPTYTNQLPDPLDYADEDQFDAEVNVIAFANAVDKKRVRDVLCFGSVARDTYNYDSDIDIALVVSPEIYDQWVEDVKQLLPADGSDIVDCYEGLSSVRLTASWQFLARASLLPSDYNQCYDIFVLPEDYASRLDEIQQHLPHDDPEFIRNIAGDMVSAVEIERRHYHRNAEYYIAAYGYANM